MFDIATHKSTDFKSQNIVLKHIGIKPPLIFEINIGIKS